MPGTKSLSVLFVCNKNIARSRVFEVLLKLRLERLGIKNVNVYSRGLEKSDKISEKTEQLLRLVSKNIAEHTPVEITAKDVKNADIILTMNRNQKEKLIARFNTDLSKKIVETVNYFAFQKEHNINSLKNQAMKIRWKIMKQQQRITAKITEKLLARMR